MITNMTPSRIEYEFDGNSYTVHGEALNPDYGLDFVIYADDFHFTDPAKAGSPVDQTTRVKVLEGIKTELAKRGTRFDVEGDPSAGSPGDAPSSVAAGQPCPREGYWFTPTEMNSRRHFKQGELMPQAAGDYGAAIWQWSLKQ
jgi:hypothetical protein